MNRVKQEIIAGAVFDRESVHNMADNLAQSLTNNNLPWLKALLPRMARVTPADIQRVAKKYLDPQKRVVVWSVPKPQDKGNSGPAAADGGKSSERSRPARQRCHRECDKPPGGGPSPRGESDLGQPPRRRRSRAHHSAAAGAGTGFSLKATRRVVLPNGLVLLLWENHRLPIVVAAAHVSGVALRVPPDKAGLATLMGDLLDEGTAKHTGQQIAESIENVGGALSLSSSGGSVKVLAKDRASRAEIADRMPEPAELPRRSLPTRACPAALSHRRRPAPAAGTAR